MISAISPVPDCHIDLKVVMEGESFVETGSGFVFGHLEQKENLAEAATGALDNRYFKNLTFTSVEKGKVVANGGGIGIMAKPGYNITFDNAYIEISTEVGGSNAIPIHATEGNITINGGHIKATNLKNCAIWTTGSSGDITINGDVTVENKLSSTAGASGIYAKGGTLTVNGGNIIGTGHNCPVLNAGKATIINGGNVNITSGYYGIYAGPESLVQIDGGTVEIVAEHASNFPIFLDSKMSGVAGANRENCEAYGEKLYTKPFLLLSDTPEKLPEVTATEAPTTEPTKPVTQPTQPSKPATQPTAATQSAQPSQGANQNNSTESGNDTILLIAAAALVLVAGAVVVVIVVKRKKA